VEGDVYTSSEIDLVSEEGAAHHHAEPNNVEQVFVLVAIGGSKYALKGSHGRYLGVDKHGLLEAKATAVNPYQTFTFVKQDAGWAIQTSWGKFISIQSKKDGEYLVQPDSEQIGFCETFVVRIQTRYSDSIRNPASTEDSKHISTKHLEEKVGRELSKTEVRKLKNAFKGKFQFSIM
jgi:protein FRG1